jgi:hypothetical protein
MNSRYSLAWESCALCSLQIAGPCILFEENENQLLTSDKEPSKVSITIAFEEGFSNDTLVIYINNNEVFSKSNVTTHPVLGYAGSAEIKTLPGPTNIKVVLPEKYITETIEIELQESVNIGISLHNGALNHRIIDEPLGYL